MNELKNYILFDTVDTVVEVLTIKEPVMIREKDIVALLGEMGKGTMEITGALISRFKSYRKADLL